MSEKDGGRPRFVGRAAALARLDSARSAASSERVVLVLGPAGIGKTTLLQTFRSRALADGDQVGWGVAGEWEGTSGLWPWFEAFSDVAPEQSVISGGGDDGSVAPDMAELFRGVARWLTELGSVRTVTFIIEDLHEADPTTVALFSYLSKRPPIPGVTVVASARPGDETIEALRCTRIALSGLSAADIVQLGEATGHSVDEPTAAELARRTNGNPLFVKRLLEHPSIHSDASVPADVAVLLRQQVRAAPEDAQPALRALAVLGTASIDVLQRMTTGAPVGPAIARVSGDVISIVDGAVSFRHGLLREVVYDDLDAEQRFALHARAADVLRAEGASPIALAHHLSRAALTHRGRDAAEAAGQAARIERATGAIREAAHHFGVAVTLLRDLGDADALADALIEEAEALALMGRAAEAEQRLIEAAELCDRSTPDRCRQLVRTYCRLRWLEEPNPSTINATVLEGIAARLLEPAADAADAAVFHTATATAGDIRGTGLDDVLAADRAVAAAHESGDPLLIGEAHLARRRALSVHPRRFNERRTDAETAFRLATQLGDHEFQIRAQRMALTDALAASQRERVVSLLGSEPVSVAGRVQQALANATLAALEGRYRDADDVLDDTLKELDYLEIDAPALEFVRIAYSWDRGELPETLARYEPLLPLIADPALRSAVALAKAISGDHAVAATLVDEALEGLEPDQPSVLWEVTMALIAESVCAIDHPAASVVYEALEPFAGQCVIASTSAAAWLGAFDRYLGLLALRLGRNQDAADHLEASLVIHDRMHAVPWAARSEAALAVALRRLGRPDEAAQHERAAVAMAAQVEMSVEMLMIGEYSSTPEVTLAVDAGTTDTGKLNVTAVASLIREGDVWRVSLADRTALVRHSNGLSYIEALLEKPCRDWHVLDLYASVAGVPAVAEGSTGPMLDDTARRAYQARYVELQQSLDSAVQRADLAASEAAQLEIDHLEGELLAAFGLGGRPRVGGDPTEKARVNVRRSISRAIDRIADVSPTLADHLRRSIRTGRFCRYEPGPDMRLVWGEPET